MEQGPEKGIRAAKLNDILDKSVKQTMRACSYEKLVSCFPTLAQNDPETLQHAQEQVTQFLTSACRSEFDKILRERGVVERLNELDELILEAKERKEQGLPASEDPSELAPEVILRAHMLPGKRAELTTMNDKIQALQQRNAASLESVESQRREIEARMRSLKESLSTLDAVSLLPSDPDSSLPEFTSVGGDDVNGDECKYQHELGVIEMYDYFYTLIHVNRKFHREYFYKKQYVLLIGLGTMSIALHLSRWSLYDTLTTLLIRLCSFLSLACSTCRSCQ